MKDREYLNNMEAWPAILSSEIASVLCMCCGCKERQTQRVPR